MSTKKSRLIVDGFLLVSVIVTFVSVQFIYQILWFHVISGTVTGALFIVHMFHHRPWLLHATAALKSGKIGPQNKRLFIVSILLFKIWFLTIISGVFSLLNRVGIIENFETLGDIHNTLAMIGMVLIVVHLYLNIRMLLKSFKAKKSN